MGYLPQLPLNLVVLLILMDERKFKNLLIKWDAESLDDRVSRWKQLQPATYRPPMPALLWEYITEADDMFIRGHFLGTILLCAAAMELVLTDQLKSKMKMTQEQIERFGLDHLIILGGKLLHLSDVELDQLNKLRKVRNALVHANAGKLKTMAKRSYEEWGLNIPDLDAGMYLKPSWKGGVDEDAAAHLRLTRDLTVKFYGAEE